MDQRLERWKINMKYLPEDQTCFDRWLFINISGVLFAGKAGELLNLTYDQHLGNLEQQLQRMESICSMLGFSYQILFSNLKGVKVLVYNYDKVQEKLSESPQWALRKIGYPESIDPDEFLLKVGRRWRESGQIPDEIGLALGYPVKDVLGFMGLIPSPCTGVCGWRVHGNPQPSMQVSKKYEQARNTARAFLRISEN
jgi:hypothetical protein